MSCSASVAMTSLTAAAKPAFHFFPFESRGGVSQKVRLSPSQFLLLPIVDRYSLWRGGEIVPQVFYKLEFLGGAWVKDRGRGWIQFVPRCHSLGLEPPGRMTRIPSCWLFLSRKAPPEPSPPATGQRRPISWNGVSREESADDRPALERNAFSGQVTGG